MLWGGGGGGGHALWESEQVDCSRQKKGNTSISWNLLQYTSDLMPSDMLIAHTRTKSLRITLQQWGLSTKSVVQNLDHWTTMSNLSGTGPYLGYWLMAAHIPGVFNVEADEEPRSNESKIGWKLDSEAFKYVGGIEIWARQICLHHELTLNDQDLLPTGKTQRQKPLMHFPYNGHQKFYASPTPFLVWVGCYSK